MTLVRQRTCDSCVRCVSFSFAISSLRIERRAITSLSNAELQPRCGCGERENVCAARVHLMRSSSWVLACTSLSYACTGPGCHCGAPPPRDGTRHKPTPHHVGRLTHQLLQFSVGFGFECCNVPLLLRLGDLQVLSVRRLQRTPHPTDRWRTFCCRNSHRLSSMPFRFSLSFAAVSMRAA